MNSKFFTIYQPRLMVAGNILQQRPKEKSPIKDPISW